MAPEKLGDRTFARIAPLIRGHVTDWILGQLLLPGHAPLLEAVRGTLAAATAFYSPADAATTPLVAELRGHVLRHLGRFEFEDDSRDELAVVLMSNGLHWVDWGRVAVRIGAWRGEEAPDA